MLHRIARAALALDLWLQQTIGRPYHAILAVGLTIEIVRRITELPDRLALMHRWGEIAVMLVMNLALLIHQVGALSHHTPHRMARRRAPAAPVAPETDD